MSQRQVDDYLQDILSSIESIQLFMNDISYKEFSTNLEKIFAVSRAIEIIGEAVKRIPNTIKLKYPNIPWRDMAGMRDKLIHDYFNTDIEILWKTIQEDIPLLQGMISEVYNDVNTNK